MAITEISAASITSPAYEPIRWVLTSDTVGIVRLRFDVYIGGVAVTQLDAVPDLGIGNQFTLEIHEVAEYFVGHDIDEAITAHGIQLDVVGSKDCYIDVFEVTNIAGTVFVNAIAAYTSSTIQILNLGFDPGEQMSDLLHTGAGNQTGFLSLRANNSEVSINVPFQLDFLTSMNSVTFVVKQYDSDGNILQTNSSSTVVLSGALFRVRGLVYPAGYHADTYKIECYYQFPGFVSTKSTSLYLIVNRTACETRALFWVNHYGGVDHFPFKYKFAQFSTSKQVVMRQADDDTEHTINGRRGKIMELSTGVESDGTYEMLAECVSNTTYTRYYDGDTYRSVTVLPGRSTKKYGDNVRYLSKFKIAFRFGKTQPFIKG